MPPNAPLLDTRLAFTHVVFGLVFLGAVLVGSHVCFFSTWSATLETCYAVSVSA